jgi:hypothetical protein
MSFGLPLLRSLILPQLRAALAHEFGHTEELYTNVDNLKLITYYENRRRS